MLYWSFTLESGNKKDLQRFVVLHFGSAQEKEDEYMHTQTFDWLSSSHIHTLLYTSDENPYN